MENVSFIAAFAAGVVIFLSPCIFPLIPAYISYLTGISFQKIPKELTKEERGRIRLVTALHSLSFIIGFTVVFVLLGASATFLGRLLLQYQGLVKRIGGAVIIFFALIITGTVKMPFLEKEKIISYKKEGISVLGSVLVGATFAAAWTPCVGPILGSILVYASSTASMIKGVMLLSAFSLGLGVPFFLSALIINSFMAYLKKIEKYIRFVNVIFGAVLAFFGFFLLTRG